MILITYGTRPEYIKVLPIIKELKDRKPSWKIDVGVEPIRGIEGIPYVKNIHNIRDLFRIYSYVFKTTVPSLGGL